MEARIQACRNVSTLAPTDVPKELATSLAPMPNAKMKEMMKPSTIIHIWSDSMATMVSEDAATSNATLQIFQSRNTQVHRQYHNQVEVVSQSLVHVIEEYHKYPVKIMNITNIPLRYLHAIYKVTINTRNGWFAGTGTTLIHNEILWEDEIN